MPFPDGTGVAGGLTPFDTYAAGRVNGEAPTPEQVASGVAVVTDAPPADAGPSMWPEGLRPQSAEHTGLPAHVTDPNSFVAAPDERDPDGGGQRVSPRGPSVPSGDVEAWLRAEIAAKGLADGGALPPVTAGEPTEAPLAPSRPPANTGAPGGHSAILYGTGVPLSLSVPVDDDERGIHLWKVVCKTGTLALSPGPGQVDLDVPLSLSAQDFDDVIEAYQEKAFPYVTIPETHANGSLENTGYVKAVEKLSKEQLMADSRISPEGKAHVEGDPEDTEYLLAGMHFSSTKAREKAQEGSIPDTSVGLKFGYRNKRSGKTFRRALEHVALTPIPWIDGLIPFNPAVALSVPGASPSWDQKDAMLLSNDQTFEFDGVFTERPADGVDLGMRIEHSGQDFDATAVRAAVLALRPGDELSWNYDVRVERLEAEGAEDSQAFYLVRAPDSENPSDYDWDRKPRLYSGVEAAMSAIATGVAVCQQRRANERARVSEAQAQPVMGGGYSADAESEGLDLAISFDPDKHPRDLEGHFRKTIESLKQAESVKLPDGTTVTAIAHRTKGGQVGGYSVNGMGKETPSGRVKNLNAAEATDMALRESTSTGPKGELPNKLGDGDGPDAENAAENAAEATPAIDEFISALEDVGNDPELEDALKALKTGDATDEHRASAQEYLNSLEDLGNDPDVESELKKLLKGKPKQNLDQRSQEQDTLSLSGEPGSLTNVNDGAQGMTLEEILAQQQADIERLTATVESQQQALTLSAQRDQSQGGLIHRNEVSKRIKALEGVYPPSVLLAAQQVMTEDTPYADRSEGFNLSVQAPSTEDPSKTEARELRTPTDVVAFMLSAMPTLDGQGQAAAQIAAINANLDDINLSAARVGAGKDPEAEARAAVSEWHRKAKPEMYDASGKLIAA